jgi:hypothetical protein
MSRGKREEQVEEREEEEREEAPAPLDPPRYIGARMHQHRFRV